jgi:ribonuclease R
MLSGVYPNGMTYSEICNRTGATKKNKTVVSQMLSTLLLESKLKKERKRYILRKQDNAPAQTPVKPDSPKEPAMQSAQLIEGIFDATSLARDRSFAFVRSPEKDYFIDSEDILNAYHNDVVLIEPKKRGSRGEHAVVRRIVKRANELIPGDISKVKNRWIFLPSNPKIHNWFDILDLAGAEPGQKVMLSVSNWGDHLAGKMPGGKITEILGKSGDPQVELMAVIRQYQLPLDFPDEVLQEVQKIPLEPSLEDISRRKDLRKLFTFTIDPASAKDFDDAISIEQTTKGWRLWVHIADVAHYVGFDSATFAEAAVRGNSFYFPKKVIPMIPERLSNQICSLRPDEDKLVMTVETEFDRNANVLNQRLYEAVIRSDSRLAYEEVDDYFEGKNPKLSPTMQKALDIGRELSVKLSKIRIDNGYVFFDLPEIEYEYDEDGFVHRLGIAEETESHKMIENFMLVANEYTAAELSKKAPTSIYRIHDDPDPQKIERMAQVLDFYGIAYIEQENLNKSVQHLLASLPNKDYHRVFDRIILRSMKKAKYSTMHIRHFGLSLENYTHFTSPIRRLCDLLVHHLCKIHVIHSEKFKLRKEQISRWASVASEQELQADAAERDIEKVYGATFMRDKIGEQFSGLVISTNSTGALVRLSELPVTAMLQKDQFGKGKWEYYDREMRFVNPRSGESFELMDSVKVRILDVSDDVYLELTGEKDSHIHYHRIKRTEAKPKPRTRRIKVDAKPSAKNPDKNPRKQGRNKR